MKQKTLSYTYYWGSFLLGGGGLLSRGLLSGGLCLGDLSGSFCPRPTHYKDNTVLREWACNVWGKKTVEFRNYNSNIG